MKKQFIIALCLLLATHLLAQTKTASRFPEDFIGNWAGELEWHLTGKPVQKVHMELIIRPSKDSAGQYSWNLIYGSASSDNRPYILKAVDTSNGHWQIDEVNGIILDQFWIAHRFIGSFTVGNSTIVNNYWIENGQLMVEFISYVARPLATTGKGTNDSPKVDSYTIRSYQKAALSRKQ
jgi:hypothetical protein